VSVNGASLHSWSFDAMNVLTWTEEAGVSSAWLQFMALPGGPIFMGTLKTPDTAEDAGALHTSCPLLQHRVTKGLESGGERVQYNAEAKC